MNQTLARAVPDSYVLDDGIFRPASGVTHRDEHYDSAVFPTLLSMQERHFWYRGRHRFLLTEFQRVLKKAKQEPSRLRVIDVGGGCGGWIRYLRNRLVDPPRELALGDSSLVALGYAKEMLTPDITRYQIDILNLRWQKRWDVVFVLDVLEHIPDDRRALAELRQSMAPGGLLFVTTPALRRFWTWNDDAVRHQRRYSKRDFHELAKASDLEVVSLRYFMFFLSPMLLAARLFHRRKITRMTDREKQSLVERTHRVPNSLVNGALYQVFACETPLGHYVPFPWGTSVLGVFRRGGE